MQQVLEKFVVDLLAGTGALVLVLGVAFAGFKFLGKTLWAQWLSKDLEKYKLGLQLELEKIKADLQMSRAKELEQLKADFDRVRIEHEIQFQGLWKKRAEVIDETYCALQDLVRAGHNIAGTSTIGQERTPEARLQKYREQYSNFLVMFEKRDLYFQRDTRRRILRLLHIMNRVDQSERLHLQERAKGGPEADRDFARGFWERIELMKGHAETIFKELRFEFQYLIGLIGKQELDEFRKSLPVLVENFDHTKASEALQFNIQDDSGR